MSLLFIDWWPSCATRIIVFELNASAVLIECHLRR